jgi:hypothetical protein
MEEKMTTRKRPSIDLDTTIPVRVRKKTREKLRAEAEKRGVHLSVLVRFWLEERMANEEQKKAG